MSDGGDRFERRAWGRADLVMGVYFAALAAYTLHYGVSHDATGVVWGGLVAAYLLFGAATVMLGMSPLGEFGTGRARIVGALVVLGVAVTWGSAAVAHDSALSTYHPMLTTSTIVWTILILRDHLYTAWASVIASTVLGLVLGPLTGASAWFNLVLPRATLTVLFIGTTASVLLHRHISELEVLLARRRADEAGVETRRDDLAARDERFRRISARVRPLLDEIASGREVTEEDVVEARLIEARLRDGIRGRVLDVPQVREAVWDARLRGVSVSVLDDGGLADAPSEQTAAVVDAVAEVLERELDGRTGGEVVARVAPAGRHPIATVAVVAEDRRRRVELGSDGSVVRTVTA